MLLFYAALVACIGPTLENITNFWIVYQYSLTMTYYCLYGYVIATSKTVL